jgi:hypothetical protein
MSNMIRFKRRKNILPKYGYIYVNVTSIQSIMPHEEGSMVVYGSAEEVYVEHKPADIVLALESDEVCVIDGVAIGED